MIPANTSLVPDIDVKINGVRLSETVRKDLLDATVYDDLGAPSMFTLRLLTWDQDDLQFTWVDDPLFSIGNEVELSFGYVDELRSVLKGEITSLELDVATDELPHLIVRGYDRRHRLLRGDKTRSFTQMKDSDIAAQLARANQLVPSVVDTGVTFEYVLQHDQTDLEFLSQRAAAIGYEVVVSDKTLFFRPHANDAKPSLSLAMNRDVLEFHPRMTSRGQVGTVEVRGWDPKQKQPLTASTLGGSLSPMGSRLGPVLADEAFGSATEEVVDHPFSSLEEASQLAKGRLGNLALAFIQGEGICFGRPLLKAGIVITLEGLGQRFSGPYYVTSTRHAYSARRGYRTGFTVRRNAT